MEKVYSLIGWFVVLALIAAGCSVIGSRETIISVAETPTSVVLLLTETPPVEVASGEQPPAKTPPLPNDASPPTETPQPTETRLTTATDTPVPTYIYLRGKVLVNQANCRYGPGWPYLYKYGVYKDSVLEIIGRNDAGSWVLVRGVGGTNACWVKAGLLQIRGDVMNVEPTYIPLPPSPYYGPLTGVTAVRTGEEVIVSWNPLYLRAGDDSEQTPYVVEAWVCQGGKFIFTPFGSYSASIEIRDEWGCSEPSHARVTAAEKHGYTAFVEVDWPPAMQPTGEE